MTKAMMKSATLVLLVTLGATAGGSAAAQDTTRFTRADSLRGGNGPGRSWWDVEFYDLRVSVSPADSSIRGSNGITYRVLQPAREMQIDLMTPLVVDSMVQDGRRLTFRRDSNAFFATLAARQRTGERRTVTVYYHGRPRVARRPPWDGGYAWQRDSLGNAWVATANQGLGASVWWPNKDTQADEPDSQRVAITVPDPMVDVSNGRLRTVTHHDDGTTTWEWFVTNPINNYDVAVNAGAYEHFSGVFRGERGPLTLDFWPLAFHREAAEQQFRQVPAMLACFEHWFGPYPWYRDGYKLVEAPHLGMEHQSAVAYGNKYLQGYLGRDRSGSGYGVLWDFIIVHESAHEWWGNAITTKDIADMWVHEAFANYAEALYTECRFGKEAGAAYAVGGRRNVRNDAPIVGRYGVNDEGSGDMYDKGGNMLHTIRQLVQDDEKWRRVLRGLQSTFGGKTVTGADVQRYMTEQSGVDLGRVFAQYLTTTKIPVLEYKAEGTMLSYRWAEVVPGFDMPVRASVGGQPARWIKPTESWQTASLSAGAPATIRVDENFYVLTRDVLAPPKTTGAAP
ncbi:M1 family metallopeptidase [Gemmatirosa kalamazoonensis]|uniref:M1 family metallopeptidase n=1 Tax=Gemmatirosa kalamazoonensis TaxID=861299 RepID=UPI0004B8385E|nr:M1 family metallopeptidase [Gemmatirosa kalamazoonensis]